MDRELIERMRTTYDAHAQEREGRSVPEWKTAERGRFLALLKQESCRKLLEIGSGPGRDGLFFKENGLDVICTDLSPEMVKLCQAKGLAACEMDFWHLDFPEESFDAVYALNCLLHVPKADLPGVLAGLRRLLRPGGLFFMGVYGGYDFEGFWDEDHYELKRLFSFYPDDAIRAVVARHFGEVYFRAVPLPEDEAQLHFQSMILRRG